MQFMNKTQLPPFPPHEETRKGGVSMSGKRFPCIALT